uniref:Uncharacterized protein n=1 Tax=Oryza meridionalis TaxID=40149 RepID=A0A0E0CL38_9ORYZ
MLSPRLSSFRPPATDAATPGSDSSSPTPTLNPPPTTPPPSTPTPVASPRTPSQPASLLPPPSLHYRNRHASPVSSDKLLRRPPPRPPPQPPLIRSHAAVPPLPKGILNQNIQTEAPHTQAVAEEGAGGDGMTMTSSGPQAGELDLALFVFN